MTLMLSLLSDRVWPFRCDPGVPDHKEALVRRPKVAQSEG
jgi:hypothetical protein